METGLQVLREETPMDQIILIVQAGRHNDLPVVDEQGHVKGMVYFRDVKPVMKEHVLDHLLIAADFMRETTDLLRPDDTLDRALTLFSDPNADVLPVVRREPPYDFLGVVCRADIMNRYQRELVLTQEKSLLRASRRSDGHAIV